MMTLKVENLSRTFTKYVFTKRISYSTDDPGGFFNEIYNKYFSKNVKKEKVYAIRKVNFDLDCGKILVVIGPNGSGKTTLLKVLAGLLTPSEGRILLNDMDLTHAPFSTYAKYFTYIPGLTASGAMWINIGLTARRNLELYAEIYSLNKSRVLEVLELVGLREYMNTRIGTFSMGMVGRLILAAGLLKEASIYLMDEPLVGLSREVATDIMNLLRTLASESKATVIYATNNLEEAERLADYILFLYNGKQVFYGTLDEFRSLMKHFVLEIEGPLKFVKELLQGIEVVNICGNRVKAILNSVKEAYEILKELSTRGVSFRSLKITPPTIEDIYIHMIKQGNNSTVKDRELVETPQHITVKMRAP